jgi:hypothetical protein
LEIYLLFISVPRADGPDWLASAVVKDDPVPSTLNLFVAATDPGTRHKNQLDITSLCCPTKSPETS